MVYIDLQKRKYHTFHYGGFCFFLRGNKEMGLNFVEVLYVSNKASVVRRNNYIMLILSNKRFHFKYMKINSLFVNICTFM